MHCGAELNIAHFNAMLHACASRRDDARAAFWFQAMLNKGVKPNVTSYDNMIAACAVVGNIQGAEEWLIKMMADGHEPDRSTHMKLTCAKRMTEVSLRISRSWAYGCIIKVAACQQKPACMKRWLDEVIHHEGTAVARALCERAFTDLSDSNSACKTQQTLLHNATTPRTRIEPQTQTHGPCGVWQNSLAPDVAELTSKSHGKCRSRADNLEVSSVTDGQHPAKLAPPPGLEHLQPTTPFLATPPGLETVDFARLPQCADPCWKQKLHPESSDALAVQSLASLPTEASGHSPLSSPRSDISSVPSVSSIPPKGMQPSPMETRLSEILLLPGQHFSF